jgi:hypothetical protein
VTSLDSPFAKLLLFALVHLAGGFALLRLANGAFSKGHAALGTSVLFSAAALRLALGVVAGVVANAALLSAPALPNRAFVLLVAFLPVRAGLWYLVVRLFLDREKRAVPLVRRWTAFGVIVSYLLDGAAIFLGPDLLGSVA